MPVSQRALVVCLCPSPGGKLLLFLSPILMGVGAGEFLHFSAPDLVLGSLSFSVPAPSPVTDNSPCSLVQGLDCGKISCPSPVAADFCFESVKTVGAEWTFCLFSGDRFLCLVSMQKVGWIFYYYSGSQSLPRNRGRGGSCSAPHSTQLFLSKQG